jgi:hypothetical protein
MAFGICDCEFCEHCPDRGLLDSECPISWRLPYDWDVPIDIYMAIVATIGCELFVPKKEK